jgi:PAS domain S-box-containing protein
MHPFMRRALLRHGVTLGVIALAGVLTSWFTFRSLAERDTRIAEEQFQRDAGALANHVQRELAVGRNAVESLQAFYHSSETVERQEFRAFADTIVGQNTSIQWVVWAPRVASDELSAHEERVRENGMADYRVRPATIGNAPAGDHFPALYCEPVGEAWIKPGFDFAAIASCQAAIDRATERAETVVVGSVALGPAVADHCCCIFIAPVYRKGFDGETAQARRENLVGVAMAVGRLNAILERAVIRSQRPGIRVRLIENRSGGEVQLLAEYPEQDDAPVADKVDGRRVFENPVAELADQIWIVQGIVGDEYFAARRSLLPLIVLVGGLLFTGLLTGLIASLVGQAERVRAQVKRRTSDLQRAKEQLEREVADHRQTQGSLRNSEALYSSLVEALPVFLLRKDLQGRFTFANRLFCELLGRPFEAIVGKTDSDFYPRELAEKYQRDDRRVIDTGAVFEDVERNEKDGETRYVEVIKSPVREASGTIVGMQAIFWDVTERKRAELALEHEQYLLESLMDYAPDHIFFKDDKCRFLRINNSLARKFGLTDPADSLGKTDFDFFTDEHARQAYDDEQRVMATGQPLVGVEEKETWGDGRVTWASTTKLPLLEEGRIVGTFGISRDITLQKQAAVALQEAKEAAEAASRAKSDFLANMSHEIRTPLNAIIGMTDLLTDMGLAPVQRDYLRMVRESGEALLGVINDILDFSKIEAGKLVLEETEFALRERLGDTMQFLGLRAHSKGLELAWQVHADVPDGLLGDIGRLRQVVVNLVGNAVKFTHAGEIVLDVSCESPPNEHVVLHFAVRDTGIGVPGNKMKLIFQAFEQADSSTTRRFGGTGLGLAISSRLVECMGGEIWAESEPGRGSTFHFTARFGVAYHAPRERRIIQGPSLIGLPVLVVDDNATNRHILDEILRSWQMQPTVVGGAVEALAEIERAAAQGASFPLILTDAQMPDIDGFGLAERIRQQGDHAGTVIMMLTSGDHPHDLARCQELRIASHLIKPVKQSELFDAIVASLGATLEPEALSAEPVGVRLPPLRILLAEDSLVNQRLAVGLLEQQGHEVTVANNGAEAFEAWQGRRFDLILMDVQMPEKDGFETTAAIRQREQRIGGHVPIVAMTAHALPDDERKCLAAGMDAYVAKPIRARHLFETMARAVGREPLDAVEGGFPASDVIDWAHALQTVRGDRGLLRSIVEAFLDECPQLTDNLRGAVAAQDGKSLQIAAHALKGAIRYFGARAAYDSAFRLENMGREGTLEGAADVLASFERELTRVVAPLKRFAGRE